MKQLILLLLVVLFTCTAANAQMNVGSNQAPDSSAMLQISGNTKGFLPPRMTRDTMLLIRNPAKGLIVFNTTDSALFMRRDTGWVKLLSDATVTSASVVTANGLAGSVANSSTTPSITLSTTVTGMVKGDGTALSAASSGTDYAPGTAANTTGIVKSTTGTGALTTATASDFPTLNQNTTGTASNITGILSTTSLPALTGAVTSTAGSANTTISNSAVTNAKMANMAANTFKANNTGSVAAPTDITATQATAMLNTFTSTTKGLVPASSGGTANFLRADGTFAVPPGTNAGTVTSVSVTSANGVTGTVATNTTTPAISLTLGAITPTSVAATGAVSGSNLSGTNTGDETTATIKTKLGTASSTTDGYLTQDDWNTFNNKSSAITVNGIVKGNGTTLSAATAGTDYAPGTAANATGIVKSTNGTGALTTAIAEDFPILNQNTTGTATNITGVLNATSLPALTGDVTSTAGSAVTTISNGAVTNAKQASMAANTFKGNNTGSLAPPKDLTATQATAMLNTFTSLAKGLVPASSGGTANFLRADGTFAVPPGTNAGTVTSVSVTSANGVSGTVATNTTTPAISLTLGDITPSSVVAGGTVTASNLSGINTGDETNATIKTKLGPATATNDGYLTAVDWTTFNNKASTTNSWSTFGNTGTNSLTNFLGTSDNTSLRFRSNNIQRIILDSLGNVGIGNTPSFSSSPNREKLLVDAGTTSSVNVISGKGSINNYLQLNIQNRNAGSNASSDIVATADNGDETTNFVDLGINSSGNTSNYFGGANDAYLYAASQNMLIGTAAASKSLGIS